MTAAFDLARVAAALTPGQRSTIRHMEADPHLLGCSEIAAQRLTCSNRRRPALTFAVKGEGGRLHGLTDAGLAVQRVILELDAATLE